MLLNQSEQRKTVHIYEVGQFWMALRHLALLKAPFNSSVVVSPKDHDIQVVLISTPVKNYTVASQSKNVSGDENVGLSPIQIIVRSRPKILLYLIWRIKFIPCPHLSLIH